MSYLQQQKNYQLKCKIMVKQRSMPKVIGFMSAI